MGFINRPWKPPSFAISCVFVAGGSRRLADRPGIWRWIKANRAAWKGVKDFQFGRCYVVWNRHVPLFYPHVTTTNIAENIGREGAGLLALDRLWLVVCHQPRSGSMFIYCDFLSSLSLSLSSFYFQMKIVWSIQFKCSLQNHVSSESSPLFGYHMTANRIDHSRGSF